MKRSSAFFPLLFLVVFTSCLIETETMIYSNNLDKQKTHSLINTEEKIIDSGFTNLINIQDFFEPLDIVVFFDNMVSPEDIPNVIRFYPFGEIIPKEIEGKASFVVFIEEGYQVEQQVNLLRITPFEDIPSVFVEIKQLPNITVEEKIAQIIKNLGDNRRLSFLLPPTDNFPFTKIWLLEDLDNRAIIQREIMYIRDNTKGGVIFATVNEAGRDLANFDNVFRTLELINFIDGDIIKNTPRNATAIQELFDPKFVIIFIEGTPELIRLYPFGEIAEHRADGFANFVVFIEDFYNVEQQDNMLRVTPCFPAPENFPEVFMEIKQVPDITVGEYEYP